MGNRIHLQFGSGQFVLNNQQLVIQQIGFIGGSLRFIQIIGFFDLFLNNFRRSQQFFDFGIQNRISPDQFDNVVQLKSIAVIHHQRFIVRRQRGQSFFILPAGTQKQHFDRLGDFHGIFGIQFRKAFQRRKFLIRRHFHCGQRRDFIHFDIVGFFFGACLLKFLVNDFFRFVLSFFQQSRRRVRNHRRNGNKVQNRQPRSSFHHFLKQANRIDRIACRSDRRNHRDRQRRRHKRFFHFIANQHRLRPLFSNHPFL